MLKIFLSDYFFSLFLFVLPFTPYRKNPKISDIQKFAVITQKVKQDGFSLE